MKKKILIISLAILLCVSAIASTFIYLQNDVYDSIFLDDYEKGKEEPTWEDNKFIDETIPKVQKRSFLGVNFNLKYEGSANSPFGVHECYTDENTGCYVVWSPDTYNILNVSSVEREVVFPYNKNTFELEEHLEWVRNVIYELCGTDISEYVWTCRTHGAKEEPETGMRRGINVDYFIANGEEGAEISYYEYTFTKHIGEFKTGEYFKLRIHPSGGISYLYHSRFSQDEEKIAELKLDERKIERSIRKILEDKATENGLFLRDFEIGNMVMLDFDGKTLLKCDVTDIYHSYERFGEKISKRHFCLETVLLDVLEE